MMKQSRSGTFHILVPVIFTWLLLALPAHAAENKLRVALEHWPPYIDKDHAEYGLATELVMTALGRAGYSTETTFENWSTALEGTSIGAYDVIVAAWYSAEREELFEFSKPYFYNEIKFIKLKNKPFVFNDFSDLEGLYIGTVANYAYSPEFDTSHKLIRIPVTTLVENLSLLQLDQIDLTLDDEWVILHQINKYMPASLERFEFLDKPLDVRGLHLMVSRNNPSHKQIVNDFDRAIIDMKSDGSFDAIAKKYYDELKSDSGSK